MKTAARRFRLLWALAVSCAVLAVDAQTISINLAALEAPRVVEVDLQQAINDSDWPRAETILFSLAATASPRASVLEALGAAHLLCGRYLQAAGAYQRADRLAPLSAASRLGLAKSYLGMEKRHWARRELERLAREEPQEPLYPLQLAGIFHDYQWFDMAEAQALRAIALSPDDAFAHDRLGQALEGRNEVGAALEAYAAALAKDRASKRRLVWPAYHLGRLLLEAGRTEEAEAALTEALRIDADHVDAIHDRGQALRKLGRWDEAVAAFETAATLAPTDGRIQYALSQIYRRLGRADEAVEAARRFRALLRE